MESNKSISEILLEDSFRQSRRKNYKACSYKVDGRRKRNDAMIQIRKLKREESVHKRRKAATVSPKFEPNTPPLVREHSKTSETYDIPAMLTKVCSQNSADQLEGMKSFRKYLCHDKNERIDEVIQSGAVSRFAEFLKMHGIPQIQFEAAWAICNIASGTSQHTLALFDLGVVPKLVKLLSSPDAYVREQAAWAIGNIASESTTCRDHVLDHGALTQVVALFNDETSLCLLQILSWLLLNLCRGNPKPNRELMKLALVGIHKIVNHYYIDDDVLSDACWALSYISDGSNEDIQMVIDAGLCHRIVQLLRHTQMYVVLPALKIVGNIASGEDKQTQGLIDCDVLCHLSGLLNDHNVKSQIKKEACWCLSNVTAGNANQIEAVIKSKIVRCLVGLSHKGNFDVKVEAAWAIANATFGATVEQIKYLVSVGCVGALCNMLDCSSLRTVKICLDALDNIFMAGEKSGDYDAYAEEFEKAEGLEKIESLQNHENAGIYEKAVAMLNAYTNIDEDGRRES